jgi:GNAT superfamily N-acetyltransferase
MNKEIRISHLNMLSIYAAEAITLHEHVFCDEFIARLGARFLHRYYRAFAESPYAVALIAVNPSGTLTGVLLGTLDPVSHYRWLIRQHGVGLATAVVQQALRHPNVARVLIRTRLKRYVSGVVRQFTKRSEVASVSRDSGYARKQNLQTQSPPANKPKVGDITHLFVSPRLRSKGVGASLVMAYEHLAARFGIDRIDLVTLPTADGGAGPFYEKLGWTFADTKVSRSGETFHLYQKWLKPSLEDSVQHRDKMELHPTYETRDFALIRQK